MLEFSCAEGLRVSSNSFSLLAAIVAELVCVQARDRKADGKIVWGLHNLSSPWHAKAAEYGRLRGRISMRGLHIA